MENLATTIVPEGESVKSDAHMEWWGLATVLDRLRESSLPEQRSAHGIAAKGFRRLWEACNAQAFRMRAFVKDENGQVLGILMVVDPADEVHLTAWLRRATRNRLVVSFGSPDVRVRGGA